MGTRKTNKKKMSDRNKHIHDIHEAILATDKIVTARQIAEKLNLSVPSIKNYIKDVLKQYDDVEGLNGVGYRRTVDYAYIVSANLYSSDNNDYIYHWEGERFEDDSDYERALDFWNNWWPFDTDDDGVNDEIDNYISKHPNDSLELEIGLWDGEGNELEFYTEGVH